MMTALLGMWLGAAGRADLPGTAFHCSFDNGLTPEVCASGGEVKGEPQFVEGRSGQALFVPEHCSVAFATEGHINPREGTVALWVKPMPPEGRPKYARLFDATSDSDPPTILRLLHPHHTILYGNVSTGGEKYVPWPMGDATVRSEEWQHLAITWGPNGATYYVNGVTLTATAEMPELKGLPERFYVGSEKDGLYPSCAPIDDLVIFDRELRSHELFELAGRTPATELTAANWLPNSSFELGPRPWQTFLWAAGKSEARLDDEAAHGGSHSFLMDRSSEDREWWSTVWLIGPWLHLQRHEEVTLSAWMRADRPDVQVRMDIQRGAEGRAVVGVPPEAEPGQFYRVGTKWQRLTLTGKLPISYKDGYRPRISLISKPCKLWIDDVQMALGEARQYEALADVELGLATAKDTATYDVGDRARVVLDISGTAGDAVEATVTVTDPEGNVTERSLSVTPGKRMALEPIELAKPGHYVAMAEAGGARASLTLCALRDHGETPSPKSSPFGTHGGGNEAARRVGLSQFRDCSGLTWRWIEREQGNWQYDDREANYAKGVAMGFVNCGTLADAPPWAARPGGGLIPADMNEWCRYVRRIITDFREYVDIWEVWNEPDLKSIFAEQPEVYFEILKATREIQQELHPEGKLAGLCGAGVSDRAIEWMEELMKLGALEQMDLLAWHPYYHELPEGGYYGALLRVNALMDQYGGRKPMILTEFGCAGVSDPSLHIPWTADGWRRYDEREQAEILVRQCVIGLGEGATKLYWYQWKEERIQTGPDTFGLVRADTYETPKLAAVAYNQMVWQLESAKLPPKRIAMASESQWAYEFGTAQGKVTVAWDPEGESEIDWPGGAKATDLWGNELRRTDRIRLSSSPVYITAP